MSVIRPVFLWEPLAQCCARCAGRFGGFAQGPSRQSPHCRTDTKTRDSFYKIAKCEDVLHCMA